MGEVIPFRKTPKWFYRKKAKYYAAWYHEPCDDCTTIYKVTYNYFMKLLEKGDFETAYFLALDMESYLDL